MSNVGPDFDQNILLIGFMGAGKSTIGERLSRLSGWDYVDLDRMIEEHAGCSINEIFSLRGEESFRDMETLALQSLVGQKKKIIATGGGIVGRADNWDLMNRIGPTIYLKVSWNTVIKRISGCSKRPLIKNTDLANVENLFIRRLPLYERADKIVIAEKKSPDSIAREIYRWLNKGESRG